MHGGRPLEAHRGPVDSLRGSRSSRDGTKEAKHEYLVCFEKLFHDTNLRFALDALRVANKSSTPTSRSIDWVRGYFGSRGFVHLIIPPAYSLVLGSNHKLAIAKAKANYDL